MWLWWGSGEGAYLILIGWRAGENETGWWWGEVLHVVSAMLSVRPTPRSPVSRRLRLQLPPISPVRRNTSRTLRDTSLLKKNRISIWPLSFGSTLTVSYISPPSLLISQTTPSSSPLLLGPTLTPTRPPPSSPPDTTQIPPTTRAVIPTTPIPHTPDEPRPSSP